MMIFVLVNQERCSLCFVLLWAFILFLQVHPIIVIVIVANLSRQQVVWFFTLFIENFSHKNYYLTLRLIFTLIIYFYSWLTLLIILFVNPILARKQGKQNLPQSLSSVVFSNTVEHAATRSRGPPPWSRQGACAVVE